jgi:AhpD family alkylhydroperoxidase
MSPRLDPVRASAALYAKYAAFSMAAAKSSLEEKLKYLVEIRASQINGCAFCVDMHVKQATIQGERPLRIHHLTVWRESNLFSSRERAALGWTEALTRLGEHGIADEIYAEARAQFSEQELTDLTMVIMSINGWNRLSIAFGAVPGSRDEEFGLTKAGLA